MRRFGLGHCLLALLALAGCHSSSSPDAHSQRRRLTPTFNQDIAPILFEHCASCHRPGQQAPFSLLEYPEVRRRATVISKVIRSRLMPPWLPERGYGRFIGEDERRLNDEQIQEIQQWIDQGCPEGSAAAKPRIPAWPDGWQLGNPDLIVRLPRPYTLRPDGADVFRNFVIPMPALAPRYVRAVEFRPDNPRILHHAAVGTVPAGLARRLEGRDGEPGFSAMSEDEVKLFGWSPGKAPYMEPPDRGWLLDGQSDLILEMHMLPSGKQEVIQPTLGLFFTSTPPSHVPLLIKLESKTIDIPAGTSDYTVTDTYVLPADVDVLSVYPHAHYLATDLKGMARLPDGTTKWLVWIKSWNFKWQDQYRYASPLFLPKGTVLTLRFTYDNSDRNPRNPHAPPEHVMNGPLSSNEMAVMWLEVMPRNGSDSAVLLRDFVRREQMADIAGAELRVRVAPDDATAHTFLATKYLPVGRVQEAIQQLQEAIRLDPRDAEAHSDLGSAFQMLGRTGEAVRHFGEALRLKPDDARVYFNLANAMAAAGRRDDALRHYRRSIDLDPDDADAHYNMAGVLAAENQLDEAIRHLRRAIQIDPRRADARHNLVMALAARGLFDEAEKSVLELLKIQPDSPQAQRDLDLLARLRRQWPS